MTSMLEAVFGYETPAIARETGWTRRSMDRLIPKLCEEGAGYTRKPASNRVGWVYHMTPDQLEVFKLRLNEYVSQPQRPGDFRRGPSRAV